MWVRKAGEGVGWTVRGRERTEGHPADMMDWRGSRAKGSEGENVRKIRENTQRVRGARGEAKSLSGVRTKKEERG